MPGDHPRLCGEKFRRHSHALKMAGSPPPMRGKAAFVAFNIVTIRITPAYAGKSPKTAPTCPASRDHPRLCGEKVKALKKSYPDAGSPPPMRGKARGFVCKEIDRRITPAYAGKRSCKAVS